MRGIAAGFLPAVLAVLFAVAAAPCLPGGPALAGETALAGERPLPFFDAHLHYSRPAWAVFSPEVVEAKLRAAGVARALLSSTPDEGALTLHRLDPRRFIPELRPYRGAVGTGNWSRDGATPAYLAERLKLGGHKGIGEFHLFTPAEAKTPVVREVVRMAVARNLVLHVHAGAAPVAELLWLEPRLRVLWAHTGLSTPPAEARRMLEAHPNLWAEVSLRAGEILPGEKLDPAWRALLLDYSRRFLVGTDTYVNFRWERYEEIVAAHRRWLALLPAEAAADIAHRNAARLYGLGIEK